MRKVLFNKKQIDRLSEFFSNSSVVFLASVVSPMFTNTKINLFLVVVGLILMCGFLLLSLIIYQYD